MFGVSDASSYIYQANSVSFVISVLKVFSGLTLGGGSSINLHKMEKPFY